MEVKCVGRNLAEPKRHSLTKKLDAARRFSEGGGIALSESGDQWAPGAIPFTEVSMGAVVPSSLHMIQYLSM